MLSLVRELNSVIEYTPSKKEGTTILVEGEIGSGKSTTLNFLIYRYCQRIGIDHKDKMFNFGR